MSALEQAKHNQIDGIIGFGGSSMDTAKVVAVLMKSSQTLNEIYGVDQVDGDRLPLILIPTTAGTGSEITLPRLLPRGKRQKRVLSHHSYCLMLLCLKIYTRCLKRLLILMDSKKEKLFEKKENGKLLYETIKDRLESRHRTFPSGHYDMYKGDNLKEGRAEALKWFTQYLKI